MLQNQRFFFAQRGSLSRGRVMLRLRIAFQKPRNVQRPVIAGGKQPRCIDAHQPVRLGAAKGGGVQIVILRAGAQMLKSVPDGIILHGGQPQPLYRLPAACHFVHIVKDGFALAPGIAGIDDLGHILPVQKRPQRFKLLFLCVGNLHLPRVLQNGKICAVPFGVALVIALCPGQLHQMAKAPAHQIPVALPISVHTLLCAQQRGVGRADRGLLCDNQLVHILFLLILYADSKTQSRFKRDCVLVCICYYICFRKSRRLYTILRTSITSSMTT